MSNSHRPSGDSFPHDDHDLHRRSNADAANDADALDARLNEIARNQGSRSTRPTSPRQRPDARTTDPDRIDDAGSLAATAASFHQQVEAAQSRHARASRPDPQLWEKIMQQAGAPAATTAASTSSATADPWTGHPAQPGVRATPRRNVRKRPPQPHRQQLWNMAANVGLVIALVLAGFGVWRIAGEPGLPGGSGDDPVTPQFAMQPSTPIGTPVATEVPAVVAPPVATPEPTTHCDFSKDIPIFVGADTSPVDGTAVLLTSDGDVLLTCDEEPNDTTLATGITQIAPMTWPGTVTLYAQDEPEGETHISVLNLLSGKSAPVGLISESVKVGSFRASGSPWLVAPSTEDVDQWAIIDLRTMESRLLSDYDTSGSMPENVMGTSNGAGGVAAFASRASAPGTDITSNSILVIDGSLDNVRWISIPAEFSHLNNMLMSPDGRHIALENMESGGSGPFNVTYAIVDVQNNAVVSHTETIEEPGSSMQWVQDGKALVYTQDTSLMLMTPGEEPKTLVEGYQELDIVGISVDPDIVLVDREPTEELSTVVPMGEDIALYAVNTRTGDVTTIAGVDISYTISPWEMPTRFLVMYDPQVEPNGPVTYRVVDATTGEQVGEIPDVPLHDNRTPGIYYPDLGIQTVVSSDDGETEIIAFDSQHIYLMRMLDGTAEVRQLPSPPGVMSEVNLPASMVLNSDGSMLSISSNNDESRTRWLLDLTDDAGEWLGVSATNNAPGMGFDSFVPGTGD